MGATAAGSRSWAVVTAAAAPRPAHRRTAAPRPRAHTGDTEVSMVGAWMCACVLLRSSRNGQASERAALQQRTGQSRARQGAGPTNCKKGRERDERRPSGRERMHDNERDKCLLHKFTLCSTPASSLLFSWWCPAVRAVVLRRRTRSCAIPRPVGRPPRSVGRPIHSSCA